MSEASLNRREFIKLAGGSAAGAVMVASGVGLTALPSDAWALEVHTLDQHQARTLLVVARRIFPHPTLADVYYAGVVESLDKEAGAKPATAALLKKGVATLDSATTVKWLDLSEGYQLEVLQKDAMPLLQKVKGNAIVSLYNNKLVWRYFGYEGESASKGGYIHRGFNDLTWLPEPDPQASPPPWM